MIASFHNATVNRFSALLLCIIIADCDKSSAGPHDAQFTTYKYTVRRAPCAVQRMTHERSQFIKIYTIGEIFVFPIKNLSTYCAESIDCLRWQQTIETDIFPKSELASKRTEKHKITSAAPCRFTPQEVFLMSIATKNDFLD